MPRYRINKDSEGEPEIFETSLRSGTVDDFSTVDFDIEHCYEAKDVKTTNPEILPMPKNCYNWAPEFSHNPTGRKCTHCELVENSTTESSELSESLVCCSLRDDYFVPADEGEYSIPFWSALEKSLTRGNFAHILLEEISLEGLDGITLQALWERLKARYKINELKKENQVYYWNVIRKIPVVSFYQLLDPRDDLKPMYREDHVDDHGNTLQPSWAPEDIYGYRPVKTKMIRGSCCTYKKRKCRTAFFASKTYDEIISYGNKMVIVAPQHIRENFLFPEDHDEEYSMSIAQFCMMERVGRTRWEGEHTKGNVSLTVMKLESKSSFHYRKDLIELGFMTRQTYAMRFTGSKTTSWVSILHLPRFYTVFETVPIRNVKKILLELRVHPENMEEYLYFQRKYSKHTMKYVTDPMLSHIFTIKEEPQSKIHPEMYLNAKTEARKEMMTKRMVRMLFLSDLQLKEGEVDIFLRETQENHVPKNERSANEDFDEEKPESKTDRILNPSNTTTTVAERPPRNRRIVDVSDNESIMYTLLKYVHQAGPLGVTLEEVAHSFSISKLDSRTAARSIQRKKVIVSYWEGRGRNKCRRYFLGRFKELNRKMCKDVEKTGCSPQAIQVVRLDSIIGEGDVMANIANASNDSNLVPIASSVQPVLVLVTPEVIVEETKVDLYPAIENQPEVVPMEVCGNEDELREMSLISSVFQNQPMLVDQEQSSYIEEITSENDDLVLESEVKACTSENSNQPVLVQTFIVQENVVDEVAVNSCDALLIEEVSNTQEVICHDNMDTNEVENYATETEITDGTAYVENIEVQEEVSEEVVNQSPNQKSNLVFTRKRKRNAGGDIQFTISYKKPRKVAYDAIDRAAILRRRRQRVEWTAEEDHCILILFVSSVVFIPNYVLGKTFIFNAAQIRDLLHKNIRDSGNKTQISVRRRLHFLMKLRKFNARYRYYLHATFSDDRVFKFVERHIDKFKVPGRGFLSISLSALSAVYTYITTHFVGINAFNEDDEHFIDAPSFGQLRAMRSFRRSEISEELFSTEDDLMVDNSDLQTAEALRQKELKKEWNMTMCQIKARQIREKPEEFIKLVARLLHDYKAMYSGTINSNDSHAIRDLLKPQPPRSVPESGLSDDTDKTQGRHKWRTFRQNTYWDKNIVLGVNEPRNISEIIIWQIRCVFIRALLTAANIKPFKNYFAKLPDYYLDYVIYSLREMEIATHSKRGEQFRIASINGGMLFRGPSISDYEMSLSLSDKFRPGSMVLLDDKTRCGTFLCINDWFAQNMAHFVFEYSEIVLGVKEEWKDVFQLIISEEFGFHVFMRKPQKQLQLLSSLVFDESMDENSRADYFENFIESIELPQLTANVNDDTPLSRLSRLDNFRRKLEYLIKILAKYRRKKNKQVDWRIYLKRERELKQLKEGKASETPEDTELKITGISDDEDTDEDEYEFEDKDSDDEESPITKDIDYRELVSYKSSENGLKSLLVKINTELSKGATTYYYSDEMSEVIEEKLETISIEEETIRTQLQENDCSLESPAYKKNYRNKIYPADYPDVVTLGKRLGSFSMANEFLSLEEPSAYVKHEPPVLAGRVTKPAHSGSPTHLKKIPSAIAFVKQRLHPVIRTKDVDILLSLKALRRQRASPGELIKSRCGLYTQLFKVIRITEEQGVSLDFLKTQFTRRYLKVGLESLMKNKFIFLVGVHNRKFISVEYVHEWSLPVRELDERSLTQNTFRRYVARPWLKTRGLIDWNTVLRMFSCLVNHLDSVSMTVDDLCEAMSPLLSTVESLILIECLAKLKVVILYKLPESRKNTLWSSPSVSHFKDRQLPFNAFLDLEDLSIRLDPEYFKRYCEVQKMLKKPSHC